MKKEKKNELRLKAWETAEATAKMQKAMEGKGKNIKTARSLDWEKSDARMSLYQSKIKCQKKETRLKT